MRDLPGGRSLSNTLWNVGARHLALSAFIAILATAIQIFIPPSATWQNWRHHLKRNDPDSLDTEAAPLRDRWTLANFNEYSGIADNRLILAEKASVRAKEHHVVANRPWEISLRWEEGSGSPNGSRLGRGVRLSPTFFLSFFESDRGRYLLELDPSDEEQCGFYLEGRGSIETLGECTSLCRELIQNGPHSLLLRGDNDSVTALVDGALCASAAMSQRLDALTIELSSVANSSVAFDDMRLRIKESGAGWTPFLEEDFDVVPFQTGWLDSRFDLNTRGPRIAVTWAALAAALFIDLAALAGFGRRAPVQVLLAVAVPQSLAILSLQGILFLPVAPLFFSIGAVWASKALLALGWRWRLEQKRRLILWFVLCAAQAMHWFWFREVWIRLGLETLILVSLIPAVLLIALYIGAVERYALIRAAGRVLAAAILVVCIEFTLRSTPAEFLLDFEWRTEKSFWDLEKHTNLIVDHSSDELFKNYLQVVYSTEKAEGVFRIVCLGSSSTAGWGTERPELETYPVQLGLLLEKRHPESFEVINAGISGYKFTQLRIFYEHIFSSLEPDLLLVYFGGNGDSLSHLEYYERAAAIVKANPWIREIRELEAGLSLRWPQPILIRGYSLFMRSRLFTGLKLSIDSIKETSRPQRSDFEEQESYVELADHLVMAALRDNTAIVLIPEITRKGYGHGHPYEAVFRELAQRHEGEPVHVFSINGFDVSSHMVDSQHMNADGHRELARIIAGYLADSGLIKYGSND